MAVGAGLHAPPAAQEDAGRAACTPPLEPREEPAQAGEARVRGPSTSVRTCSASSRLNGTSIGMPRPGDRCEQVVRAGRGRPASSRGRSRRRGSTSTGRARSGRGRGRSPGRTPRSAGRPRAGCCSGTGAARARGGRSRTGCTASLGEGAGTSPSTISGTGPAPGEGRLDRVEPAPGRVRAADQPVDDDVDDAQLPPGSRAPGRRRPGRSSWPSTRTRVKPSSSSDRASAAGRSRQDLEREGDLVARALGQRVDRRGDDPGAWRARPAGRSSGRRPGRPGR